jgi:catechol 2,3-dioxygenase-like lactoylglutathione lyase family enzyme
MRKSLSSRLLPTLLLFVLALAAIASPGARAATLYGTGYARVGVPDLAQAVAFFQDVLDCRVIGPSFTKKPATSRLLSCDTGSIVELFDNHDASTAPGQPLRFVSDDVRHGGEWLRREGATVNGSPHRLTSGPLAGRMVLDFKSPWGMPLQLLDSHAYSPVEGTLATVAAD